MAPSAPSDIPHLLLFTTGGTIASRRDPATGDVRAAATAAELLALAPELAQTADIEVRPFAQVNSWNITPAQMWDLAGQVEEALADPGVAGAVVTHGTDTAEETAYLLDLVVASDKPIVFTVAMRHLEETGGDGPRNLLDATRVAAHPAARGRGTMLVMNETIHAARDVTKTHTTRPDSFESPESGPLGTLTAGTPRFFGPKKPRATIPSSRLEPEIAIVKTGAGMDDRPLRWAIEAGYRGIIVEGTGAGNVPAALLPAIVEAIARGIPVVLCSRCPRGYLAPIYGGGGAAGGGKDLERLGVIFAHRLPSQKARIKLMVALGATGDLESIRELFADEA